VTKLRRLPLPRVTETDVSRAIKAYLQMRGFRMYRRNTGGAYSGLQFVRFSEPGAADLTGREIGTGRTIEVEVKRPGGRTKPERQMLQQAWLDLAKRDGCIAFRASSIEEAEAALEGYGYGRGLLV
jgi:hypothetical protein